MEMRWEGRGVGGVREQMGATGVGLQARLTPQEPQP